MNYKPINFTRKFEKINDYWKPRIVAKLNDYHFKVAKVQGDFVWHTHEETDEIFIVHEGTLRIDIKDGSVELNKGEMFVVPKGVEHKPFAERECSIILVEPAGTLNTGDAGGERTVMDEVWI